MYGYAFPIHSQVRSNECGYYPLDILCHRRPTALQPAIWLRVCCQHKQGRKYFRMRTAKQYFYIIATRTSSIKESQFLHPKEVHCLRRFKESCKTHLFF